MLCLASALALCALPSDAPNIVLIVTDDQGYGDYSYAEHGALQTPNLDRLRRESPKVDRFYVSPVCSPTRASLMTGRWNYRTGVTDTWIGRSMMRSEEVTIAERLGDAGYATGIFGKWHLGDCYPMRPMDQGFDTSLVHRGGGLAQPSEPPENRRRYTDPVLFRNGVMVEARGYCTDVFFDAALEFIDASLDGKAPFFCYVATNAPHDPFHDVPAELYEKYAAEDLAPTLRGKSEQVDREARICAMIENVDQNVGRLLQRLEERRVSRDTIVVFLSDNGPLWGRTTRGLRGYKTQPHEGGIRSPLFVRWPGQLNPETHVPQIAAHVDVLPTLLEAAGVEGSADEDSLDGRSLLPLLRGEEVDWRERHIFLQSHRGNAPLPRKHFAVVGQRWKLVRASGFSGSSERQGAPYELFDLVEDPAESANLAAEHPRIVADLKRRYDAWFQDVTKGSGGVWTPPAIVLDADAEPTTALTRQDLWFESGEGWSGGDIEGVWHLRSPEETVRAATLLFTKPREVSVVRLEIREADSAVTATSFSVSGTRERFELGEIQIPKGEFTLSVRLWAAGEETNFHQLELGQLE
ncbi:MAG: arylsulfatase [Planctomycetota bacterium]